MLNQDAAVRKQAYIEPYQEQRLKRFSQQEGVPEAEIIRRAIDEYPRGRRHLVRDLRAWEQERAFIEHLIALGPAERQRTWRRRTCMNAKVFMDTHVLVCTRMSGALLEVDRM